MLTAKDAERIVTGVLDAAERRGLAPLCVAVLDAGGHLIALRRADGASIYRPQIAIAKASGCLGMGFGGRELARRAEAMPLFIAGLNHLFPQGLLPVPGGILLRDDLSTIIGAVGVSGDTSENDEACALEVIRQVGFVAES